MLPDTLVQAASESIHSLSTVIGGAMPLYGEGAIPVSTPTYISILTLAVSIVAGLLTIVNILVARFSYSTLDATREARRAVDRYRKKAESGMREFEREVHAHRIALREGVAGFQPSGEYLSEGILELTRTQSFPKSKAGVALKKSLEELSRLVLENAEFGQQVQKLFVGTADEVRGSVYYLSQNEALYAVGLLKQRLVMEQESDSPSLSIVESLAAAIANLEAPGLPTA